MFQKLASTVIMNNKNEVLLMLRDNKPGILNPGKWGLIGGHIEDRENALQTAIREIKEETGLIIKPKKLKSFITITNPHGNREVFLAKGIWTNKDIIKGEGQDIKFIKLKKALLLPLGVDQHYILSYLKSLNQHHK